MSAQIEAVAARLRDALDPYDRDALAALLDDNVRWGGSAGRKHLDWRGEDGMLGTERANSARPG